SLLAPSGSNWGSLEARPPATHSQKVLHLDQPQMAPTVSNQAV
ncbi:MAG: hypothetical protein ACI92S_002671, partial [Planctomycetaceae bacterium]